MELSREFRERFVRSLQGRDYILYGGVLQLAKERGLRRISTRIIQIPSKDNSMYAVVEAEVETEDGVFSEVGDASPESVARSIQPHLLRMATTRAKARAMRDAVGIDMVALEELGDALPDRDVMDEEVDLRSPEDLVIRFGKYSGKTLGEIYGVDRGYVEWLSQNARDEAIRDASRELMLPSTPEM
ncbi:MAG TPA: hypothetical protein PK183_04130 [Bacillota bacterium]|jgi:hypothetical protein|nr:hypothetical protein [Bacillota bacterium]HQD80413.1 hypothetical protein [Bacillota bacterium]